MVDKPDDLFQDDESEEFLEELYLFLTPDEALNVLESFDEWDLSYEDLCYYDDFDLLSELLSRDIECGCCTCCGNMCFDDNALDFLIEDDDPPDTY